VTDVELLRQVAACDLIREIDINRETHDAHRDTETDRRALYAARERYDEIRGEQ
jgi:hypothetical protein